MKVTIENKAGIVEVGRVREYRKCPSSINLAASAAAHTAKRLGERVIVVEGNSYGNKVYHIARESEQISKYTVMKGIFKVLIVEQTGECYYGVAE